MHSAYNGQYAGGKFRISNKEATVAVAQKSEFLAVNQKIRVRVPAVTPFIEVFVRYVPNSQCGLRSTGHNCGESLIFVSSRGVMYSAPRFERGGCRRNSCREHQRNVNRTSEPGFPAKEIVAHLA